MGKSKKKSNRGRRRPQHRKDQEDPQQQPPQRSGSLLQRLRHGHAPTRQAALTALAEHPQLLVKEDVRTVVSELVVSQSVEAPSAATAAECLGNYLVWRQQQQQSDDDDDDDPRTAGWLVLLLRRLQSESSVLAEQQPDSTTQAACLRALVLLLETNPVAVERLVQQQQQQQGSDCCFAVLTRLLQQSLLRSDNHNNRMIQMWICRAFHSAWEDNPDLVLPFFHDVSSSSSSSSDPSMAATTTLQVLHEAIVAASNNNNNPVACLHGIGAWMAAWMLVVVAPSTTATTNHIATATTTDEIAALLESHVAPCCQLLLQTFTSNNSNNSPNENGGGGTLSFPWEELTRHRARLQDAHSNYQRERSDGALERAVVRAQDQKKEPARQIAKRLKQQQQQQQKEEEAAPRMTMDCSGSNSPDAATPDAMAVAVETSTTASHSGKIEDDRQDRAELWEEAVSEWESALRPAQLALEIVANLTSVSPVAEVEEEEGDDDVRMDDDEVHAAELPAPLVRLFGQCELPNRLLQFFGQLVAYYEGLSASSGSGSMAQDDVNDNNNDVKDSSDNNDYPNDLVRQSWSDLLAKAAIGLGHCLANLPTWSPPDHLWSTLREAARLEQGAVSAAMVMALRRPDVMTRIQQSISGNAHNDDLDHLLALLQKASRSPVVARDCVCMLGMLLCNCSSGSEETAQQSAAVHERVCHALLEAAMPHGAAAAAAR